MIKTIRISREELHKELKRLQGEIQAENGESTSMDDVIEVLLITYRMKTKRK